MADQDSDQEKTEEATPQRQEKARKDGQVPRSRELTTFMLLLGGVGGLWSMGAMLYGQLGLMMEQAFLFDRQHAMEPTSMLVQALDLGKRTLFAMMPFFSLLVVIALVAPALLGGWLISAKSLKPQLSKLNPAKGIKRILGAQALVELSKAFAKAILIGGVGASFLYMNRRTFMSLMDQPIQQALAKGLTMAAQASGMMVLTLLVVIMIDVPYQLFSHAKKLRMSKDEIKREHKESEGDPQVKARIRQQQQAMSRGRMMSKVPEADVIVTNPTHYAVALQYREGGMAAPRVIAKGADAIAARIRELGDEHEIPRLEAPPLARSLYQHVDLDQEVPAVLYTAIAEVMAWAFGLKRAAESGSEPPPTPSELEVPDALSVPADSNTDNEAHP